MPTSEPAPPPTSASLDWLTTLPTDRADRAARDAWCAAIDADAPATAEDGLWGVGMDPALADVWVMPVPVDVTTSYRTGTAQGPAAVLHASVQVDLHDADFGAAWRHGVWLAPGADMQSPLAHASQAARPRAERVIAAAERGDAPDARDLEAVEAVGRAVHDATHAFVRRALQAGRLPVVLGGDHSAPLGAIRAAAATNPIGILHVDAHADLRVAYEGFAFSHASVMHGALEEPNVTHLVGIGWRDMAEAEHARVRADPRISMTDDATWARARRAGRLDTLAQAAIDALPARVWLSVDIDGLSPTLCPNTGTPVPGGLDWHDFADLLVRLARSGKTVVGADLCEVSPGSAWAPGEPDMWDAMVGARALYKIIGAACSTRAPG